MNKRIVSGVVAALLATAGMGVLATPASANITCVVTQGYVKNNVTEATLLARTMGESGVWDDVIAHVPGATTLHDVLGTAPRGDAYLIAAHQFIAAAYNGAIEEASPEVQAAFYGLATYLQGGNSWTRDQVLAAAAVLDAYNNGLLNVAHC
jgi:hypothetical protein